MRIEYEKKSHFLIVKIIGEWTEAESNKAIDDIKLEGEKMKTTRILLNLLELSQPENNLIRHSSGKKIAEALSAFKIAGFSQPEKINHLAEITATNRGANFKMFESEIEAINWLIKE